MCVFLTLEWNKTCFGIVNVVLLEMKNINQPLIISSVFFQVKPSQKTSVTQKNVSPAHNAQVYYVWRRPAQTPMMPPVYANMATI